jgi:ABC-type uncharacterized transport system substrate-binding protein
MALQDAPTRQVTVIVTVGTPATLAAKAATNTIPIVFGIGGDPVQFSLVTSLNRPGGNITGVNVLNTAVMGKRLELLHELVPATGVIALLTNPRSAFTEIETKALHEAARALGVELRVLNVASEKRDRYCLRDDLSKRTLRAPCGKCRHNVHEPARSTCRARGASCHSRDVCVP